MQIIHWRIVSAVLLLAIIFLSPPPASGRVAMYQDGTDWRNHLEEGTDRGMVRDIEEEPPQQWLDLVEALEFEGNLKEPHKVGRERSEQYWPKDNKWNNLKELEFSKSLPYYTKLQLGKIKKPKVKHTEMEVAPDMPCSDLGWGDAITYGDLKEIIKSVKQESPPMTLVTPTDENLEHAWKCMNKIFKSSSHDANIKMLSKCPEVHEYWSTSLGGYVMSKDKGCVGGCWSLMEAQSIIDIRDYSGMTINFILCLAQYLQVGQTQVGVQVKIWNWEEFMQTFDITNDKCIALVKQEEIRENRSGVFKELAKKMAEEKTPCRRTC